MNKPGTFKRDFNLRGWAIALTCAIGVAEVVVKFVFPLVAKVI